MLTRLEKKAKDAKNAIKDAMTGNHSILKKCEATVDDWRGIPIDEQVKRNEKKLDELVIPWDELVNNPTELGARTKKPLIFMHVPKSGGTTLEYLIAKNYTINGVIHINAPALEKNPKALFKKGELPHAIMGHHKLNQVLYQFVDQPFVHITMLREPVGRILSYYNYLRTSPNHGLHKAASSMTLEEFVDSRDMVEIHNAMAMRLAGFLKRSIMKKRFDDPEVLKLAKHNLTNRFSIFGMTSKYTEFLLIARKLLGWSDIFYQRRNVSKSKTEKEEVSDNIMQKIRERNGLDIELYDFAIDVFQQRYAELGMDDSTVEQFNKLNAEYASIVNQDF